MPEIRIRWRRYGRNGGRWRADLPSGNGINSGSSPPHWTSSSA
jgi:hypothetical protein